MNKFNGIKILVASTVYGFEDQLSAIYAQLDSYGYDVMNSHSGTVYAGADKSNLDNCLQAVGICDAFLGIIRPTYGSGVIGDLSITHQEIQTAITKRKARWFLVDSKVTFTRQLLKHAQFVDGYNSHTLPPERIHFQKNSLLDMRCINMYNEVIQDKLNPRDRIGHWVQEYYDLAGIQRFIEGQFRDLEIVRRTIESLNNAS
jgi:hypothetical protein